MNNNIGCSTNAKKVYEEFEDLTHKELGKALKQGLRKALRVIQKDAKKNLSGAFKKTNRRNPKYSDTLQSGIRVTRIFENQDGTIIGKVRIDSSRKTGSGSFRLKILEKGNFKTSPRYTKTWRGKPLKKLRKTGDIQGSNFFKKSIDSNEASFQTNVENEVNKAIEKINNKNLK
jgi:hypothetical protein